MTKLFADSKFLLQQAASLLVYQSVLQNSVGKAYINLLNNLYTFSSETNLNRPTSITCLKAYSNWFQALAQANLSWRDYLIQQILLDDNPFSRQVQTRSLDQISPSLVEAAKHDLIILQRIYQCRTEQIVKSVQKASQYPDTIIAWHQETTAASCLHEQENWSESLKELAIHYRKHGTGIFARYNALTWHKEQLQGITCPDPITLGEIIGYESQKETLVKNTEFLLAGYAALNVLLYGSRMRHAQLNAPSAESALMSFFSRYQIVADDVALDVCASHTLEHSVLTGLSSDVKQRLVPIHRVPLTGINILY